MEQLNTPVYECTLPVEAHMICDLLSQAGISARVDGEFLAGAGGELPLGNTIKVRVDPARAAEAREVIADWEKSQPADKTPAAPRSRIFKSPFWFFAGLMAGVALSFIALSLNRRVGSSGVDYNGDGRADVTYRYQDSLLSRVDYDRNFDDRVDLRWTYDSQGIEERLESDDDFDGRFEWRSEIVDGSPSQTVLDADGDGRPEQVWHLKHGVLNSIEYYFASGGRVVKREHHEAGLLVSADFDDDGDGVFERRVQYDAHGEPKL